MANISVVLEKPISDGSKLKFRTPCESTLIEGLEVKTPAKDGIGTVIKKFVFKDAHGAELCGFGNLFVGGVLIEVLLDVTHGVAFIQNADTNSYVEGVKSDIQRMEEVQKEFLKVAGESVEECERAAEAIYIGDGEMPEKALIQIDPSGSVIAVDTKLDENSDNLITNKAVAIEFKAVYDETRRIDETVAEISGDLSAGVAANANAIEGKADLGYGYCEALPFEIIGSVAGVDGGAAFFDGVTNGWASGTAKQMRFVDDGFYGEAIFATVFKASDASILVKGQTMDGFFVTKVKEDGVWSAWLWDNPPMKKGVEYATTERYKGKVVYTKLIEFGALPNPSASGGAGYKAVSHDILGLSELVGIEGTMEYTGGEYKLFKSLTGSNDAVQQIGVNDTTVYVSTNPSSPTYGNDYSKQSATIVLKYTKG